MAKGLTPQQRDVLEKLAEHGEAVCNFDYIPACQFPNARLVDLEPRYLGQLNRLGLVDKFDEGRTSFRVRINDAGRAALEATA